MNSLSLKFKDCTEFYPGAFFDLILRGKIQVKHLWIENVSINLDYLIDLNV